MHRVSFQPMVLSVYFCQALSYLRPLRFGTLAEKRKVTNNTSESLAAKLNS